MIVIFYYLFSIRIFCLYDPAFLIMSVNCSRFISVTQTHTIALVSNKCFRTIRHTLILNPICLIISVFQASNSVRTDNFLQSPCLIIFVGKRKTIRIERSNKISLPVGIQYLPAGVIRYRLQKSDFIIGKRQTVLISVRHTNKLSLTVIFEI